MNIHCTYQEMLPIGKLSVEMAKKLKVRTKNSLKGEMRRLLEYGFFTPIFVWKNGEINEVVDGVGRILALKWINEERLGIGEDGEINAGIGEKVTDVPAVFIDAENYDEARKKVLLVNSMFGKINKDVLDKYTTTSGEAGDFIKCHSGFFETKIDFAETGGLEYNDSGEDSASGIDIDELLNIGAYSPIIDTETVDSGDIEKADKKIKKIAEKKPVELHNITCKNCGHTFSIGK